MICLLPLSFRLNRWSPLLLTACCVLENSAAQNAPALAATPATLSLWTDPEFSKRFIGSFGFNGVIEPTITETERAVRLQVEDLMKAQKLAEAIGTIQKALTKDTPGLDFLLGNLYFQAGQLEAAEICFRNALGKFSNFRDAAKNLGYTQARLNKHPLAIKSLGKAIGLGVSDPITYGVFASALLQNKQPAAAETAFRLALMFEPENPSWKLGMLQTFVDQAKYVEVVSVLNELIQANPDKTEYLAMQAKIYLQMERNMAAAENFEILARAGKASPEDLNTLAKIYLKEGRPGLAQTAFDRAMIAQPNALPGDLLGNAEMLFNQNGQSEAKRYLAKVKSKLADKFEKADQERALKLSAKIASAEGATEDQIALLEEAVALNPTDGYSLIGLAKHYMESTETLDKAAAKLEMAAKINPDFEADALLMLAQIDIKKNKHQDALPRLKRSYEIKKRDNVQAYIQQIERYVRKSAGK